MRGDFDEDEDDDVGPFVTGACAKCGQWRPVCCGKDGVDYCVKCCEHPWEDDDEDIS